MNSPIVEIDFTDWQQAHPRPEWTAAVEAGQVLATVEAMKMENVLRAERRAVVKRIAAEPGASLAVDELILEFEA